MIENISQEQLHLKKVQQPKKLRIKEKKKNSEKNQTSVKKIESYSTRQPEFISQYKNTNQLQQKDKINSKQKESDTLQSIKIQCPICTRQKQNLYSFFECQHMFCEECCLAHVKENLLINTLPKCLNGCNQFMKKNAQRVIEKLSGKEKDRYSQMIKEKYLEEANLIICPYCPNKEGVLIMKQGIKENTLSCIKCEKIICKKCFILDHQGDCQNEFEYMLYTLNNINFSKCPNCSKLIQKIKGCNHMACKCKKQDKTFQFCFECQAEWNLNHACDKNRNRKLDRINNVKYLKLSPGQREKVQKQKLEKEKRQQQSRKYLQQQRKIWEEKKKQQKQRLAPELSQIKRRKEKHTLHEAYYQIINTNLQNYSQSNSLVKFMWKILLYLSLFLVWIGLFLTLLILSVVYYVQMWIVCVPFLLTLIVIKERLTCNAPIVISILLMPLIYSFALIIFCPVLNILCLPDVRMDLRCIWAWQVPYYLKMNKILDEEQYPALFVKLKKTQIYD